MKTPIIHLALALALSLSCTARLAFAATLAKPLSSVIGELRVSKTPVLMPTWLPKESQNSQTTISEGPFRDGYEVSLGTCNADTSFFTSGGLGAPSRTKRTVPLDGGRLGYVNSGGNFYFIDWASGKYCYRVGVPNAGRAASEPTLLRIIKSMVPVSKQEMYGAPHKEERLLESYKRIEESAKTDARILVGQKYSQAIDLISQGNFARAEAVLEEVIKQWSDCSEIPPRPQVQFVYALVLKKLNRTQEAQKIEQQYAAALAETETALKAAIEAAKQKSDALSKDDFDYSRARNHLGNSRRALANLYVTCGRYEDAEALFKAAFHDQATAHGRQSADARVTADQYGQLLRMMGKNPSIAKQLTENR